MKRTLNIIMFTDRIGEVRSYEINPRRAMRLGLLAFLVLAGALLYGGVGIAGMLAGSNFLDYSVLADDPVAGQKLGIILIEAGVGMTVCGVLLSIYHAFASRDRSR